MFRMCVPTRIKTAAFFILILIFSGTHASAIERVKMKLVFSPTLDFLMDCSIAIEKGYFDELGLDLDYVTVKGSSTTIIGTLLLKEVNGVFLASPSALTAIDKGVDIVHISGIGNRQFEYAVLSKTPYTTLNDLKGCKIGNTRGPSGPWLALMYDLDHMGVQADAVEIDTGGDRISALLTGHVDASLMSPQFKALYGDKVRTVHIASSSKYIWNSCGWWLKREFLDQHPEAAERFVNGLAKARKLINTNADEAVAIFSKYGKIRDDKFIEPFQLAQFDDPPVVYQYGLQKTIEIMNEYKLLDNAITAENIVDGRFAAVIDKDY